MILCWRPKHFAWNIRMQHVPYKRLTLTVKWVMYNAMLLLHLTMITSVPISTCHVHHKINKTGLNQNNCVCGSFAHFLCFGCAGNGQSQRPIGSELPLSHLDGMIAWYTFSATSLVSYVLSGPINLNLKLHDFDRAGTWHDMTSNYTNLFMGHICVVRPC